MTLSGDKGQENVKHNQDLSEPIWYSDKAYNNCTRQPTVCHYKHADENCWL